MAGALGMQLQMLRASSEPALANVSRQRAGALMIAQDAFFSSRSAQLATLTVREMVPRIHPLRDFATAGGLISYGRQLCGRVPSSRRIHWSYSQVGEAGRATGTGSVQV